MKLNTKIILLLVLQHSKVNSYNITETSIKLKNVLREYKSEKCKRCVNLPLVTLVQKSVDFFHRTGRFGEFLTHVNSSDCVGDHSEVVREHVLSGLVISDDFSHTHWDEYKTVFNKVYEDFNHEIAALSTWQKNLRRVAEHNQLYLAGRRSFSIQLNQFGDLGPADYFKKILKLIDTPPLYDPAHDHHKTAYKNKIHHDVPKKVDWRSKGFEPRREEQWQCGACYAFAVTHAVQGQLYKRHRDWKELSPQQIVDCSGKDGNFGCEGGSLRAAMRYAAREGLLFERYYPYKGKKGSCHVNRLAARVRARRWAVLPAGDERAVQQALATIGPLAVAVNAAPLTFQLYRSGIYDDPFCTPWQLNHAMLLVGYTPEYWLLLNWWGRNWGEDGYIRIRRGFNRCGVASMATYVEI